MDVYRFMERLHPVDEAVSLVYSVLRRLVVVEESGINESLGRYIAADIYSSQDIPPYNKSVLDGCAARSVDVGGASPESPAFLIKKGAIPVDRDIEYLLRPGECVEVATGSKLPVNADVVIPAEYISVRGNEVIVTKGFGSGYGVATRGEDLKQGTNIASIGDRIDDFHIGLLATLGYSKIKVWKLPRACIFSTGDELVEPGSEKDPGKLYASTARLVKALLEKLGFKVEYHGLVGDSRTEVMRKFEFLLSRCPIVISTGGTSVGKKDLVIRVVKEKFSDKGFLHGIALTPGRPMGIGITSYDGKDRLILSLSGMPVAAYTEIIAVVEPALSKVLGRNRRIFREFQGVLERKLVSRPGMTNYVRARTRIVDGKILVSPLRLTGSGILSTLLYGDSMIIVPPDVTGYNEGEIVNLLSTRLYG
ncbi:MAG: molybdopterin molybdotransferase MoeA [Desulfurococcales archaeon]|nr:molybdopterin molybdotransferase MoeA [Desulfurococcales archaeon]